MFRRLLWITGGIVLFIALFEWLRPGPPPLPWQGKQVWAIRPPHQIEVVDRIDSPPSRAPLGDPLARPFMVLADEGKWCQFIGEPFNGWARRELFVPDDEALNYFTRRLQANAQDMFARLSRGCWHARHREYDKAVEDLTEYLRAAPRDDYALQTRGLAYEKLGQMEAALRDLDEAVRLAPQSADVHFNRGYVRYHSEQFDTAVEDFTAAIQITPTVGDYLFFRGLTELHLQREEAATLDIEQAIKLDPALVEQLSRMGQYEFQREQFAVAVELFNQLLRYRPEPFTHYWRGRSAMNLKQHERALNDFDVMLQADPNFLPAIEDRAIALLGLGRDRLALADIETALARGSKRPGTWYCLGIARLRLNQMREGIAAFDHYLELEPGSIGARLERGLARLTLRDAGGLEDLERASQASPPTQQSGAAAVLGYVYARILQKPRDADTFLSRVREMIEGNPYPLLEVLQNKQSVADFLSQFEDLARQPSIRGVIGLYLLGGPRPEEAKPHLQWVLEHASRSMIDYTVAREEMERLKRNQ